MAHNSKAQNSKAKGPKSLSIKKGDTVKVIAGRDKGAEGKVIQVLREEQRVIVEGVNRVKRHTKVVNQGGRAGSTGGIITQEASIHASNVMLLTEVDGKKVPTRIGAKRVEVSKSRTDGTTYTAHRSVRVASRNGEEI
jgi:large subunit ribosomal protein L24